MPYTRKTNRGRGLTKKQRSEVKKIATAPMERKRFPVYKQGLSISTSHHIDDLSSVYQGSTEEGRTGDAIKIISGHIKGVVVAADTTNIVRYTVLRWKPNTIPTAADIYDDATIGANGAMFSPFNHINRPSFVVLADRYIDLEATNGDMQKMFNIRIKPQPKTIYEGGANTGSNKLYIIWSSDSVAITHPDVTYRGDIHFLDC